MNLQWPVGVALLGFVCIDPQAVFAKDFTVPATPPGVTMEPARQATATGANGPTSASQTTLDDANGLTLYTFAGDTVPGQSACDSECIKAWPAVVAAAQAKPSGDWSVVTRTDGTSQWAYKGKPLYRSVKDVAPGDTNGRGADNNQWQVATVQQTADEVPSPASVKVKIVPNAFGAVFVDYKGMTLYTSDGDQSGRSACSGDCAKVWIPLRAAGLAIPVGDWSFVRRDDGTRQWAYKGQPLYSYTGDIKAGDAKGMIADVRFHPAALRRFFMPAEVTARINNGFTVLATSEGRTLYARDKFRFSFGSYSVNDGPPPTPAVGRSVGTAGCEGDCAQTWQPLIAAKDSQPSGFWSIASRSDGTRQWAYQGYPVYTNAQDKKPGEMRGRDLFDLTDGSHALYWRVVTP
jgi:predicted lipoprotein with Yx(FWY)xxD motif